MSSFAKVQALKKALAFDRYDANRIPLDFDARMTRHSHSYALFTKPIEKSDNDKRDYRLIRLDNGIEAMLVSDPKTDRSAACMSIRVGSMHDPPELQGLAHYCEHLLFCGSHKYPVENEYSEYISRNGGDCNAFTSLDNTSFTLSIRPTSLGGALDRMAHIFIKPLFEASVCDREINAIDSEFKQHLEADGWREDALRSFLATDKHPYKKFNIGSIETLKVEPEKAGIDVRQRLIDWHAQHYSANLMRLCIVSNHSLDALTEMTAGLFQTVPNQNREPSLWPNPFLENPSMKQTNFLKVRGHDVLELTFALEDQSQYFKTAPACFFGNLIGHEGKGSLLSYLKSKDYASSAVADLEAVATGWSSFQISLTLTERGINYTQDICLAVFAFVDLIKNSTSLESLFSDYLTMQKIGFRFQENGKPDETADSVAQSLHEPYDRSKTLLQNAVADKFDKDLIMAFVAQLNPRNCSIFRGSQKELDGKSYDRIEPFFGVRYGQDDPNLAFYQQCQQPPYIVGLSLPTRNLFIPHDIKRVADKPDNVDPAVIHKEDGLQIWHKRDATFLVPKAIIYISLRNAKVAESARSSLCARLFTDIIEENLNEATWVAAEAGLGFGFGTDLQGFELSFSGYSTALQKLIDVVASGFSNVTVEADVFNRLKFNIRKGLENWSTTNSSSKAGNLLNRLLTPIHFTQKEKLAEISTIEADEVLSVGKNLLQSLFCEAYIHGSLTVEEGLAAVDCLKKTIAWTAQPDSAKITNYVLPAGTDAVIRDWAEDINEVNHSVINCYQSCLTDDRQQVMTLALLIECLSQRMFDELRTKKQLGYSVSLIPRTSGCLAYCLAQIESETFPDQVDREIEAFFVECKTYLLEMADTAFSEHRDGLIENMKEEFKEMSEEASYNDGCIESGRLGFRLFDDDARRIATITKEQIYDQFQRVLLPNDTRVKVSVQVRSKRNVDLAQSDWSVTDDAALKALQRASRLAPQPTPYPILGL